MTNPQGKTQSRDATPKITEMLERSHEHTKAAIITVLCEIVLKGMES